MPCRKAAVGGSLLLSCAFFFFACRWTPTSEILVQIKASEPGRTRAPASASDFNCYFINVTGDDVKATFDEPLSSIESCSSLGTVSSLLDLKSLRDGVELKVVAGSKRTVELWGVTGTTSAVCSGELDTLTRARGTEIYKVSSTVTDLFLNSSVDLANDFDKETKHTNCTLGDATQPTMLYTPLVDVSVYFGSASGASPDSGDWDGNLPPPTSGGSLSGPMPAVSYVGTPHAESEQIIRADFTFRMPATGLAGVEGIRFILDAVGGTVPFDGTACATAAAITGTGYRYEFWDQLAINWTLEDSGPLTQPAESFNRLLSPVSKYVVPVNDGSRETFPAFHVTVRSRDNGNAISVCSALRINSISADLVTLAR